MYNAALPRALESADIKKVPIFYVELIEAFRNPSKNSDLLLVFRQLRKAF